MRSKMNYSGPVVALFFLTLFSDALAGEKVDQPNYDDYFTGQALRIDLIHSGTRGKEIFGLDELVTEPIWPGTRVYPIDTTGFGKYRFRVFDKATGTEIFSQGYCTLFGEWITTGEAADGGWRSMSEPIRIPYPKAPFVLAIEKRSDKSGEFEELQRMDIDPTAYDVRQERSCFLESTNLFNGESSPQSILDIVIIPDGYTIEEAAKMEADARRFTDVLLRQSPFDKNKEKIAVRLVNAYSVESGPDEPRKGIYRNTVVDTTFDTFRSPRYLTTYNMKVLREVAAVVPYDTIFVMVNSSRYGGGGIFNSYSIFTSDSEYSDYVMIHEFGHGFGALADEYFDSQTSYDPDAFYARNLEPWAPNLTAENTREELKWKHLLTPDVPIPTPDTDEYDGVVGLFEGGGYKVKGLFRPTRDSKMHHKGNIGFGPVNETAIETMIRYYTDREAK